MFEHLDDPLQHERDLSAEYGVIAALTTAHRRRRSITVTTLALSLVITGGVSGLALGGPDSVHAPIGKGPLLAIGDPRSTSADQPLPALVGGDRTNANGCPSAADPGHPTAFAAAAVSVTGPLVIRAGTDVTGSDAVTSYPAVDGVAPVGTATTGTSGPAGTSGLPQPSVPGPTPAAAPHPVTKPHPTGPTTPAPTTPAPTNAGGTPLPGVPGTPIPTTPPVTTGGGADGGTGTGTPDPTPDPSGSTGSGDQGTGASDAPTPTPSDPISGVVDQLPNP